VASFSVGNWFGIQANKVFRISRLGHFHDVMAIGTLSGVEMWLAPPGVPYPAGGAGNTG
jgi:alanine-glyoxylate transaminase/serine-glyoxylate transaminase/serine-pyruvate transaminase